MKNGFFILIVLLGITSISVAQSISPNPNISRGKPVFTSAGSAVYLIDNNLTETSFHVSNGSWIAINVGEVTSKVFLTWNNPNYSWSDVIAAAHSCKQKIKTAVNYTIEKSSNSTNGIDGDWEIMTTVTDNNVTARGHLIDFTDADWIKMNISKGAGSINEVEVFNVSDKSNDLWFFPGTSISANAFKATAPANNFADMVHDANLVYTPAMIRGGIPCIYSGDLAADISMYLAVAGNVKYWAVEMGTNDAWGGSDNNVSSFKKNMQTVIDACKAAGIQPILARIIGTNKALAKWQIHPDFLKAIDDLTIENNLITGPDFYTWFITHPNEFHIDGVHPNAAGAASIQKLWAEKMDALYKNNE
jgi:lysophospholipase L1-like esterase